MTGDPQTPAWIALPIIAAGAAWAWTRYPVLKAEYDAKVTEIEERTGRCGGCGGTGVRGNHSPRFLRPYPRCRRCRGTGEVQAGSRRRRARDRRRGRAPS